MREQLFQSLPRDLAMDITARFPDITYLAQLPGPTQEQLRHGARVRLEGKTPVDFASLRRREAAELLLGAYSAHARGDERPAIELAYQSDVHMLEAYLVESAVAAGDRGLWTVELRWELGTCAIAELADLPENFELAVTGVREALSNGLGEPDGARFLGTLPVVAD
jgi:hypothetical protein